jgi:hypothetical protein
VQKQKQKRGVFKKMDLRGSSGRKIESNGRYHFAAPISAVFHNFKIGNKAFLKL